MNERTEQMAEGDADAPRTVSDMIGLVIDSASSTEVLAHIDIDERHHQGQTTATSTMAPTPTPMSFCS